MVTFCHSECILNRGATHEFVTLKIAAGTPEEYLCLCEGKSLGAVGSSRTIDSPLQTIEVNEFGRHFSRTTVSHNQGRASCTKLEARLTYSNLTMLAARDTVEVLLSLLSDWEIDMAGSDYSSSLLQVLDRFVVRSGTEIMLLSVKPLTGRTHQIRVHLASVPPAGFCFTFARNLGFRCMYSGVCLVT